MLPIRDERSLISIFSHDDGIIHGGLLHESEAPKSTSTPLFISGFFPPNFMRLSSTSQEKLLILEL